MRFWWKIVWNTVRLGKLQGIIRKHWFWTFGDITLFLQTLETNITWWNINIAEETKTKTNLLVKYTVKKQLFFLFLNKVKVNQRNSNKNLHVKEHCLQEAASPLPRENICLTPRDRLGLFKPFQEQEFSVTAVNFPALQQGFQSRCRQVPHPGRAHFVSTLKCTNFMSGYTLTKPATGCTQTFVIPQFRHWT